MQVYEKNLKLKKIIVLKYSIYKNNFHENDLQHDTNYEITKQSESLAQRERLMKVVKEVKYNN